MNHLCEPCKPYRKVVKEMNYTKGNKMWGLPNVEAHPATVAYALVKILDRDSWSLEDIHDASQLIEQEPIIKEVVLCLIAKADGGKR